MTYGTKSAKV